jgi:hypothetical protein
MKTLKFALIAALLACTVVSLANSDGFKAKPKKIVNCTFEKAITIPGLLVAMYQQLDDEVLGKEQPSYTLEVVMQGTLYRITGSRSQWVAFFSGKYKPKMEKKINLINHN